MLQRRSRVKVTAQTVRFIFKIFGIVNIGGVEAVSHNSERNLQVRKGTCDNAASAGADGYSGLGNDRRKVDADENGCSTSDGLAVAGHAVG